MDRGQYNPDFGFDGGRVLYHGSNSPVFTDNDYRPHEPQFATAPILDVVRRARPPSMRSAATVSMQHTPSTGEPGTVT